jgi:hypothetical protein
VIGQILDYAAYAAENWSEGRLRQLAADYWRQQNRDVDDIIRDELGLTDAEEFWGKVETNLKQCQIRLIIVADELRPEVRRVIEFLNQQMRTVQVFGLEVRCFGEDPNTVIVPFLVGQTQVAAVQKSATLGRSRNWTIEEVRNSYAELGGVLGDRLLHLLDWAVDRKCAEPGKDTQNPLFNFIGHAGRSIVQVAPRWIYPRLQEDRWTNGAERDSFVADLKKIGLYPNDFDPASTKDGKNTRRIEEWTDGQLSEFLQVLSKYCGSSSSSAVAR